MCGQDNCCRRRCACQSQSSRVSRCGMCACGCSSESVAPTAAISMADYEPFILVPTSVFDQGDVGCDCGW